MKLKAVNLLLAVTLAIIASGCAGMPPQSRPMSIEPFLGKWTGNWQSNVNLSYSGKLSVEIITDTQNHPNGIIFTAISPQGVRMNKIRGELRNGELVSTTPWRAELTFALHGKERLKVTYFNPVNQDRGIWSLSRE